MKRAIQGLFVVALALNAERCDLAYVDWELVLAIATGVGMIGYLLIEHKRTSKLDDLADEHTERLLKLELIWAYAAEQSDLDALELRVSKFETPPDVTQLAERTATMAELVGDMRERLATVEARMDHKPITQTRRKDGKFGAPGEEPPKGAA